MTNAKQSRIPSAKRPLNSQTVDLYREEKKKQTFFVRGCDENKLANESLVHSLSPFNKTQVATMRSNEVSKLFVV